MTDLRPNPYAVPQTDFTYDAQVNVDRATLAKIEAIAKDAGQFWLAILMCLLCVGVGSLIIGPWYLVRLIQWSSVAQRQPQLLDPHAPHGSLARRFQSAKVKLAIGICFGAVVFVLAFLGLVATLAARK